MFRINDILRLSCLVWLATVGLTLSVEAQQIPPKVAVEELSDAQIRAFLEKARQSGLNEAQIEEAALGQGFTPSDVVKLRQRIGQLSDQKSTLSDSSKAGKVLNSSRLQTESLSQKDKSSTPTASTPAEKPLVFGSTLFSNKTLTFEPDLRLATPKNYVLGPDDELIIDITGYAQATYRPRVSPEGSIRLENLSPIYVNGLSIEEASSRIVGRLRQRYEGLNVSGGLSHAHISLGSVRSIKVTIVGEVNLPGTYTVSSLATVFNALYLAGGPSANGSFRNVKLLRNNKIVKTIDLYDFLLKGDQQDNARLFDQDVIFVSDYATRVELRGEVKRPALYETHPGETLQQVLAFAGGFTDQAYTQQLNVQRSTGKELKLSTVAQADFGTFVPQNGDRIEVGKILNRYENRVEILGAVLRPGAYALEENTQTVRQLIAKAEGLRGDAFLYRASLSRERENLDAEVIAFDLGKLMRGEIADIPLRRQDVITVTPLSELREGRTVSIVGGVNKPGEFEFVEKLSIGSLIVLAGGLTESATTHRIEVSRRIKGDSSLTGQNVQIFTFDLDRNLSLSTPETQFVIQPFDVIYVRNLPQYQPQREVYLGGEVLYPGRYAIKDRSERITDLLSRAGGLKSTAFLPGVQFSRRGKNVAVDIRTILQNPSAESNLLLDDGDSLVIPRPIELVAVAGGVLNPMTTNYEIRFSFRDYLARAGGFETGALRRKTYITYPNGTIDRTRRFLVFNKYPKVQPGSTIFVPVKKEKESGKMSASERVAIISGITSILLTTIALINNLKP